MVKRVEYITPAVQEKISTAHLVLVSARQTMPRNDDEMIRRIQDVSVDITGRVNQLAPNIHGLSSELCHHLVKKEGVAGT